MKTILNLFKSIKRRMKFEQWITAIKISTPKGISVLDTTKELESIKKRMRKLGIPQHRDHYKNWDMEMIYSHAPRSLRHKEIKILDAGSGGVSTFLELSKRFFRNAERYAIDYAHADSKKLKKQGINYSQQDISATNFESEKFDFICSISVIEHGVDVNKFLEEMSRIIKDDGMLLITTDFWCENIDTSDKYPYGKDVPAMKIFNADDIKEIIASANKYGLEIQGVEPEGIQCKEKVVFWERMNESYTFIFLPFVKKSVAQC